MRIAIMMMLGAMSAHLCAMNQDTKFMLPHDIQLRSHTAVTSTQASTTDKRMSETRVLLLCGALRLYSALINPRDPAHIVTQVGLGVLAGVGVSCLIPGTDVAAPVLVGVAVGTVSALRAIRTPRDEQHALLSAASLSHKIAGKPE